MSTDTIHFTNQPSTSYQVAGMVENNPNSLLLQINESTANHQNIIHDDGVKLAMLFVVIIKDTKKVNVIL